MDISKEKSRIIKEGIRQILTGGNKQQELYIAINYFFKLVYFYNTITTHLSVHVFCSILSGLHYLVV